MMKPASAPLPSLRIPALDLSLRAALLGACAAALLSACGTAPMREPEGAASTPSPRSEAPAAKARRGGGYYKDDGPGDNAPENLDAIPDAQPRFEPLHRFANRPYKVFGQEYVPLTQLVPFRERGHASWYGRRFHGVATSSGEPYDMYAMTAAHPTLPIPSYARVTNVANGRSVVVRVNDRGPFLRGRIMDLSYTAAYRLGYIDGGSAEVEVEQILPDDTPAELLARAAAAPAAGLKLPTTLVPTAAPAAEAVAKAPSGGGIFLQLGAFSSRDNAEGFRASVQRHVAPYAERIDLFADGGPGGAYYRLHAGPYASEGDARVAAEQIAALLKLKPFVVVR